MCPGMSDTTEVLDPVEALIRLGGVATWPELRVLTSRREAPHGSERRPGERS